MKIETADISEKAGKTSKCHTVQVPKAESIINTLGCGGLKSLYLNRFLI
jgi:hypothetical protein